MAHKRPAKSNSRVSRKRFAQREAITRLSREKPDQISYRSDGLVTVDFDMPIARADANAIENLVASVDPFCVPFESRDGLQHPYKIETYRYQRAEHGAIAYAFLDRNIMTRVVELARGARATDMHRSAAAIVCFCQCAKIFLEPALAMHEFAASVSGRTALEELGPFDSLVHTFPAAIADVALGRRATVEWTFLKEGSALAKRQAHTRNPVTKVGSGLFVFGLQYATILKLATLECTNRPAEEKLLEFFEWVHEQYLWDACSSHLAARYLATQCPKPDWLSGIRSPDREKALRRIRNFSWDAAHVAHWIARLMHKRNTQEKKTLWMLSTLDRAVRDVARSVVGFQIGEATEELEFAVYLRRWFGSEHGTRIVNRYLQLLSVRPDRSKPNEDAEVRHAKLIADLEAQVLAPLKG